MKTWQPLTLSPDITVNRVLHYYPQARALLERLGMHPEIEGCECLDEVAWCHGLSVEELIRKLEAAIDAEWAMTGV